MKPYRLANGQMLPRKKRKPFEARLKQWASRVNRVVLYERWPKDQVYYVSRVDDPLNWDYSPLTSPASTRPDACQASSFHRFTG